MNPEVAANFSGGGFSNYFSRPDFQNTVVPTYLNRIGGKYYGLYKYVIYMWESHGAHVYLALLVAATQIFLLRQ